MSKLERNTSKSNALNILSTCCRKKSFLEDCLIKFHGQ